jgi:hypothetical protein
MKLRDPNPLDYFGMRRADSLAPHFVTTYVGGPAPRELDHWIASNLKGRYYIDTVTALNSENKIITKLLVGFEKPAELSMFMISCPLLS